MNLNDMTKQPRSTGEEGCCLNMFVHFVMLTLIALGLTLKCLWLKAD